LESYQQRKQEVNGCGEEQIIRDHDGARTVSGYGEFRPVDRTFLLSPWVWSETVERWRKEGLPTTGDYWNGLAEYFRTDLWARACPSKVSWMIIGTPELNPGHLKKKILSETEEYQVIRDRICIYRNKNQ